MKLFSRWEIFPVLIIIAVSVLGIYLYPQLPDQVPFHWNINGQIDNWCSKTFAVSFFPAFILGVYALVSCFVFLDPLKKNIESFSKFYFWIKTGIVIFLSFLYAATLLVALGYDINVGKAVALGVAALFLLIGMIMPSIKKNYTVGIRFPWTLYSESVWNKTHKFGGKLFIFLAVMTALSSFGPMAFLFWTLVGGIFWF